MDPPPVTVRKGIVVFVQITGKQQKTVNSKRFRLPCRHPA